MEYALADEAQSDGGSEPDGETGTKQANIHLCEPEFMFSYRAPRGNSKKVSLRR